VTDKENPMRTTRRPGVTLLDIIIVVAVLAILAGLLLPAIQKVRAAASRAQSTNNLKQIALAVHNYESVHQKMPPGADANGFSAFAQLLPYVEQNNLYQLIDFKKQVGDKANDQVRSVVVKTYISPRDPQMLVNPNLGPTNYLFSAGTATALADNNGVFYPDSKISLAAIPDGTSNTVMAGETLRGDGGTKAVTVDRQHILLKAADLKGLGADTGAKDWKAGKNVVGNRCASWFDGRFLQTMFTGTLKLNDPRPDVDCGGAGGQSALRDPSGVVPVAMCDGSVRTVSASVSFETWQNAVNRKDGNALGNDF
jgi:type II secretory pathway pseudopilin PulG